jgi:glutamate-1-semialdehyde aminotransferase
LLRPIFTEKNIINKFDRNKYDPIFAKSIKFKNFLLTKNIFLSANCCFFISYCHTKKDIENLSTILKTYLAKFDE